MKRKLKGEYGYLRDRRIRQWSLTLGLAAVVAVLYAIGYVIWDGKANILTLFAVLFVLPAAKAAVGLIVLNGHRPVSADEYAKIEENAPGKVLYDVILSSTQAISFLPAVYCRNTTVYFYINNSKYDVSALEAYIREIMVAKREGEAGAQVRAVKGFTEFSSFCAKISADNQTAHATDHAEPETANGNIDLTQNESDIRYVFSIFSI